jgi:hypothetical protein
MADLPPHETMADAAPRETTTLPPGVLAIRRGPGANCSSIGSVIDILFVSAAVGGAVLVAIAAALEPRDRPPAGPPAPEPAPDADEPNDG